MWLRFQVGMLVATNNSIKRILYYIHDSEKASFDDSRPRDTWHIYDQKSYFCKSSLLDSYRDWGLRRELDQQW